MEKPGGSKTVQIRPTIQARRFHGHFRFDDLETSAAKQRFTKTSGTLRSVGKMLPFAPLRHCLECTGGEDLLIFRITHRPVHALVSGVRRHFPGSLYRRFFSNCMFNARPRISLVSTSKLAGVPASNVFSPLTIDS
jgi:hypothetical protein